MLVFNCVAERYLFRQIVHISQQTRIQQPSDPIVVQAVHVFFIEGTIPHGCICFNEDIYNGT
jgi:hypothetical protein